MGFEIADLRGLGPDYKGQMVVYLAAGDNPITDVGWATYIPDPGFVLNTPRAPQFDDLNVMSSPYQPSGVFTYFTDGSGFTWQAVAAVENRVYPFNSADYPGYSPPLTDSGQAGYAVLTPLPGTIQYNSNDKNHENVFNAEDSRGNPKLQHFVTDPWGNVYILKSVNAANDTPEKVAAAVDTAVLPDGWTKSSGYLDADTTYLPVWSGDVAHANEFRDSADSAWMQIEWGKSGYTLAAKIGDGLEIWGGNTDDTVKGNAEGSVMHGGDGDDLVLGWRGKDTITGDLGNDELRGGRGSDMLLGGDGNDTLKGGRGDDVLIGGRGNDTLVGGRGNDALTYDDLDMGRDKVLDFGQRGKDVIDLAALDADASTPEDDAFAFIGLSRFSGSAGELRYRLKDGDAVVLGDTDGDRMADFVIKVRSVDLLLSDDFVLWGFEGWSLSALGTRSSAQTATIHWKRDDGCCSRAWAALSASSILWAAAPALRQATMFAGRTERRLSDRVCGGAYNICGTPFANHRALRRVGDLHGADESTVDFNPQSATRWDTCLACCTTHG